MTTCEYHYTECGLDDVFILADHLETDDHGEAVVTIPAIGILHKIIAEGVINADGILTGKEIRFLRTEMGMTQAQLANILHRDSQSIARWEKSEVTVDATLDLVLRQIAAEKLDIPFGKNQGIEELCKKRVQTTVTKPIKAKLNLDKDKPSYTIVA
jgi:transcriptional regulator with XRE-family HTH domain